MFRMGTEYPQKNSWRLTDAELVSADNVHSYHQRLLIKTTPQDNRLVLSHLSRNSRGKLWILVPDTYKTIPN